MRATIMWKLLEPKSIAAATSDGMMEVLRLMV